MYKVWVGDSCECGDYDVDAVVDVDCCGSLVGEQVIVVSCVDNWLLLRVVVVVLGGVKEQVFWIVFFGGRSLRCRDSLVVGYVVMLSCVIDGL